MAGTTLFYHENSSAALRVLLCLRLQGSHADRAVKLTPEVDERGIMRYLLPADCPEARELGTREWTALSKEGRVPALMVGQRLLTQSGAIVEYLNEVGSRRRSLSQQLLPVDAWQRAEARRIMHLIAADAHPLQNMGFVRDAITLFGLPPDEGVKEHPIRRHYIRRAFAALEGILASCSGRFAVGDALTLADCFLVPQVRNALGCGVDVATEFPKVYQVWDRCIHVKEIREVLEESGGVVQQDPINTAPSKL